MKKGNVPENSCNSIILYSLFPLSYNNYHVRKNKFPNNYQLLLFYYFICIPYSLSLHTEQFPSLSSIPFN